MNDETGYLNLKYERELKRLVRKMIRIHRPKNPIEYALLQLQIVSQVSYHLAISCCRHRTNKRWW